MSTSSVGSGLLTFQFGTYDSGANSFTLNGKKTAQNVSISSGQTSVAAIRDAVNAANIGVSASIVNDGSGSRLVFASKDSGAANSIRLTVADADSTHTDTAGLSQIAFDPSATAGNGKNLSQAAAARDAALKIDGIDVSSASNIITDAIQGVTLTLAKANPGGTVAVQITRDSAAIKASIGSLVRAYNDFNKTVSDLTAYDPGTKQAGFLQGDAVAIGLQRGLRTTLNNTITGLSGNLTRLSQLGISFQKDGALALDDSKLQAAIDTKFDDIAGVFASVGRSSDTRAIYTGSSVDTRPGNYAVDLTQAATRGTLTGNQAAGLTISAGVNDSLMFDVDGDSTMVTIAAGTYASPAALAAELQSRINGSTAFQSAGIAVAVSESAGILSVSSNRYGSASSVVAQASATTTNLFGASPLATAGLNVAGTINGVLAQGSGQVLTGAPGDASAGLALKITASTPATLGSVQFSRGYASQLKTWASDILATKGALNSRTEGLGARIKEITRRQDALNTRLEQTEKRYRSQFAALDAAISRMTSTSTYLQTQLANLPKISS